MSAILEHNEEPTPGLPGFLPGDERMLWQGRPDWRGLARTRFHVRKLTVYFGIMLILHQAYQLNAGVAHRGRGGQTIEIGNAA